MEVQTPPAAPLCWSNILILKQQPDQLKPQQPQQNPVPAAGYQSGVLVGSCKSSKGIAVAIVDANAVIQGGQRLAHLADRFVSVAEVITEIRDPTSRHSLNFLPFTIDTLEPSTDALKKVINFAKATGDLQTLSDVDLKLIALTYTLEAQIHGTQHLRDSQPPIHTVSVKRLPEKDLPGWGSNVPNLEEWEALEHAVENGSNLNSKILPLKDLSLELNSADQCSTDSLTEDAGDSHIGSQEDDDGGFRKPVRYFPKKREVKIEGKMMVADGIDASQGQFDDDTDGWRPAVSRSTHRRYLRRKARREMSMASSELGDHPDTSDDVGNNNLDDAQCPELLIDESYEGRTNSIVQDGKISDEKDGDISASLSEMKLDGERLITFQDSDKVNVPYEEIEPSGIDATDSVREALQNESSEKTDKELVDIETRSQANESVDTSQTYDISSEGSWGLRSLSESSVACVTGDFAMQNVLLQMGLRLLAPGGMQIRELQRWVLKCHACFKVTTEIGRIFCPTCGNGGTLRKVAVNVNENGILLAARRPRTSLRGTKFSLPSPQGGRDAVTKNPILREDQLPRKFLYPKTKKKNKQEDDFIVPDDIFRHTDRRAPHQPPVRKALAVFSGRRNPNDNHFAPPKR